MVQMNQIPQGKKEVIIDVRERDEFEAEHVEGAILVPLSQFAFLAPGVLNALSDRKVVLFCRSGNRANLALNQISQLGYGDIEARVYEGGLLSWKKEGKKTIARQNNHLPIMRQVQIVAGSGVFLFALLGALVAPLWSFGAAFFGAGLVLAGTTGFCGMAELLARLPWNRVQPGNKEELCAVSPASGSCGC